MDEDKPQVDKRVIVSTEKLIRRAALSYRNDDTKLTAPNLTAYSKLLDSYRGIIDRAQEDDYGDGDDYYSRVEQGRVLTKSEEEEIKRRIAGRKLTRAQIREIEREVTGR